MADVKFATTREALSTAAAGNTQNFTAPSGFGEPKAAIFILSAAVTNNTQTDDASYGIGFAVGTTQEQSCSVFSDDNTATVTSYRRHANTCINLTGDASIRAEFEFTQWLNVADDGIDGVQLTIVTAAADAYLCQIIWVGGADVTNAHVGSTALSGSIGVTQINTVGFNPDLVFLATCGLAAESNNSASSYLAFGAAHNGGNQRSMGWASLDNADPSTPNAALSTTAATGRVDATSGWAWQGIVQGFDADGFEIDINLASSAHVKYLCLKFQNSPSVAVVSTSLPTTGDWAETAPGFLPTFGMAAFMSGLSSSGTTSATTGIRASLAAFDASSIFNAAYFEEDNQATSDTKSISDSTTVRIYSSTGTTYATFNTPVFDASGWDLAPGASPADIVYGWALAIGAGAATAAGIRSPLGGPLALRNPLGRTR